MARELHIRKPVEVRIPVYKCAVCHDSGIIFLVSRDICGIADLIANSKPCTCAAGEELKEGYVQ